MMTLETNTDICKCGDVITDVAVLKQQNMDLERWNIPAYQRCERCVAMMFAGYSRCVQKNKPFKVNEKSKQRTGSV